MNLEDFVAVSGLPGVYKMAANRSNGLIVEDLDSGKRKFVSARKHQFTPLASIGIYTLDDTEELDTIFKTMINKSATVAPIPHNSKPAEVISYFKEILPDYDEDRVYLSDMKKVIKWFNFLNERNLLSIEDKKEEAVNEEKETKKAPAESEEE
jgi:hypothetical protein